MDICSPFDDLIPWHQLDNGRLFYILLGGAPRLAMKVELAGERGTSIGCLFFAPKMALKYEQGNCTVFPLAKAALTPGQLGTAPNEYPQPGELVQMQGGPHLIVVDAGDYPRAVQMSTGTVRQTRPRYPDEMVVPFRDWKIVLPSPLSPNKWEVIHECRQSPTETAER